MSNCPTPTLIQAHEGIGKTYSMINMLAELGWDEDAEDYRASKGASVRQRGMVAIASKSYQQCHEKHEECLKAANSPGRVVLLKSFSRLYSDARDRLNEKTEITREDAGSRGYPSLIAAIKALQPDIFDEMCSQRDAMWNIHGRGPEFDPTAVVIMVHSVLQNWQHSFYSRAFLHPEFPDGLNLDEIERCRGEMRLRRVIYDEIDPHDLVCLEPKWKVDLCKTIRKACKAATKKAWDEATLADRVSAYTRTLPGSGYSGSIRSSVYEA